jgi:acetyl-CoA carboxylase biotin carboxyl carrier protein
MSGSEHVVRVHVCEGDASDLLAPSVGIFIPAVEKGQLVSPGQLLGWIEVLGVRQSLRVPDGVAGRVSRRRGEGSSRVAVQYGDALVTIAVASLAGAAAGTSFESAVDEHAALSFVAPMSGRFYSRPSPADPPFVTEGDIVKRGQTIGLLEVMKTFNRLVYQGDSMPESALVERIVPDDGDDVARGDVILVLGLTAER